MKKSNFIFSFLFSVIVLFGAIGVNACKNEPPVNLNVEDNTESSNKNAAYLSVLDVKADFARTALPSFDLDTVNDFVFTLKGKLSDSVQTENETIIGTYENLTDLKNAQIGIETGTWILTLTAAKDGTVFTGTKEIEIIAGNNSISFEIQWDENALSGEGNLLYTLDFSKAYNKIDVMLVTGELVKYNPTTKEETAIEAYKETPLDFTDYKVTYELTDVPADVYRIKIHLYADTKKKIQINTYPELAIITGGYTSTAAREMTSLSSVCFVYVKGATIKGAVGSGDSASPVFIEDRTVPIGDLYVCDHEVTQSEYEMYCMYGDSDTANRPSSTIGLGAHFPVYFVSWYDALVYCNLRSKAEKLTPVYKMKDSNGEVTDDPTKWAGVVSNNLTGEDARYCGPSEDNTDWNNVVCDWSANGYRLPTEAEWEYIARGGNGLSGTQYIYAGSDSADTVAWHSTNSNSRTHEIKGQDPNTIGLYDLSGNVWELCWDWYPDPESGTDAITQTTAPYGISSGIKRIKRGGSYTNNASLYCNVYNQNQHQPQDRTEQTGFRVVRNASFHPLLVRFDTTSNYPGNTAKVDSIVIDEAGKTVTEPSYSITKYGCAFKGWYTKAYPTDTDSAFNFASPITDNITLYAVWEADFVLTESFTFAGEETLCKDDADRESKVFIKDRVIPFGDLWVSDHEVTQGEYEKYCCYSDDSYKPLTEYGKGSDYPVYYVSWYDAIVYCNLRSEDEGLTPCYSLNDETDTKKWTGVKTVTEGGITKYSCSYITAGASNSWKSIKCDWNASGYRLPTEAEWEYAARGANLTSTGQTIYSGTDDDNLGDYAWYENNSGETSHPVKGKLPNALNLYDMTGNVAELCWDWYKEGIEPTTPVTGETYNPSNYRVFRGGGFTKANSNDLSGNRVNTQGNLGPYKGYNYIGFRVVRNASFHPLLVRFDTTTNYPRNTAKVDFVVIDEAGQTVSLPAYDGTRSGYTFKGWYTSATPEASAEPFDFTSQITEDTTLYAVWKSDFVLVEGMTVNSTNASSLAILKSRELTINDFCMGDHEVTQKEWVDVMGSLPVGITDEITDEKPQGQGIGDDYPVYYVTWYATIVYCNKLSISEGLDCAYSVSGKDESYWQNFNYPDDLASITTTDCDAITLNMNADGYRLPTEVEWEYAARGGKALESYKFAGSDDYTKVAWARENGDLTTHPVKTDKTEGVDSANSLGLYDMCGNVNEWVWDFYNSSSTAIGTNTPITGATSGSSSKRVKKGGGWDSVAESGDTATIDRHSGTDPTEGGSQSSDHMNIGFGFRVVQTATTNP